MQVQGELPDTNAEEMAKEGLHMVKSIVRHRYRQGWRFLTRLEGFRVEEATWESFPAFVPTEGRLNSVVVDHLSQNNLGELLRLGEMLASQKKPRALTLLIPSYLCVSSLSLRTQRQATEVVS